MKTFLVTIRNLALSKKIILFLVTITFFFFILLLVLQRVANSLPENLTSYAELLLIGLKTTAKLTLISAIVGTIAGLLLALLYQANNFFKYLVTVWVGLWRGTPLLVQILFAYYALPELLPEGINLSEFEAASIALGLNLAAYNSEVFRAGINSIPKGQWEGSFSLGLTKLQTFRLIIFPQALKLTIPPLLNNLIGLIKDTSLASSISLLELSLAAQRISSETFKPVPTLTIIAILYLSLTILVSVTTKIFDFEGQTKKI
jgi:polar amino acid transport system permease protein